MLLAAESRKNFPLTVSPHNRQSSCRNRFSSAGRAGDSRFRRQCAQPQSLRPRHRFPRQECEAVRSPEIVAPAASHSDNMSPPQTHMRRRKSAQERPHIAETFRFSVVHLPFYLVVLFFLRFRRNMATPTAASTAAVTMINSVGIRDKLNHFGG